MKKILLGLTTITDWKSKVKEICDYGIEEIALFPTMLNKKERQELYKMLENPIREQIKVKKYLEKIIK